MEPQTLLIGVASFVLSFIVIYLISVFTMREKTFEEVLEEQRKRQQEEERKAKIERRAEKGERKKYRKFKEKSKDKSTSSARENQPVVVESKLETPVVLTKVALNSTLPSTTKETTSKAKTSKKSQKPVSVVTNNTSSTSLSDDQPQPLVAARSSAPLSVSPAPKEEAVVTVDKNVHSQKADTQKNIAKIKESKNVQKSSSSVKPKTVAAATLSLPQATQEQPQQQQNKKVAEPSQKSPKQQPQQQSPVKKQPQPQQKQKEPTVKPQKQSPQLQVPNTNENVSNKSSTSQENISTKPKAHETKAKDRKPSKAAKQNANEEIEKQILIVEQKQQNENVAKKNSKKQKSVPATISTTTVPVVQNVEEKSVKDQTPKEKKTKKAKTENEATGLTHLISSLKGTTLNDSEIQTLLDLLQSKQNKKSPATTEVAVLQKQLVEKEKKINNVTEGAAEAQQVVTELKHKIVTAEKQYENKIKKLQNENKTLQSEAKKTELSHEENIKTLKNQIKQLESNTVKKEIYENVLDEVTKLKNAPAAPIIDPSEMASMKQKVQIMEKELSNNVLKLNYSEKKRIKFEERIKEFEAKANNENQNLIELNLALKNSNLEKDLLIKENKKVDESLKLKQAECTSLKNQLNDKELNNKEIEKNLMNLSKKIKELEEELMVANQKNLILAEENKLVHEKPLTSEVNLGERQEPAGAPNGDVKQEKLGCTKVAFVEHERLLGEKQSEIIRLTTEIGNKELEATARLDEKDCEIKALTTSLNVNVGEVEKLREEIQMLKNKNDELRKKNWKAMEAVERAEKTVGEKINSAVKNAMSENQSFDKTVLKRIFPDISVLESLENDEWLNKFEAEAVKYINSLKDVDSLDNKDSEKLTQVESRLSETLEKLTESESKCNSYHLKLQKLSESDPKSDYIEDLHKQIETLKNELKETTLQYEELQANSDETKTKTEDRLKELELTFSETKTLCMSLKDQLENTTLNNSTEEYEKQVENLIDQLKDSNENVKKLETQVKKYQNLLKVTDDKLQILQKSVEDEELKWRREKQALQTSLLGAQKELEQLKQMGNMSVQLSEVNSQEEKEEKYKVLVLQAEENEKKVRDLSQTIVKLNGIIKTGQDALSQEQKIVNQLKKQLTDINSSQTSTSTQKMEELKRKLAQKEKEVEQGQMYNNALSQKLAQLGVMASTVGNDVGTSV